MDIKVLGTGCTKCRKLFSEAEAAVKQSGLPATLTKVEDIDDIVAFGVMMTPALVIDGEVVSVGRIPRATEIVAMMRRRAAP